jgi:hypothetical protein
VRKQSEEESATQKPDVRCRRNRTSSVTGREHRLFDRINKMNQIAL